MNVGGGKKVNIKELQELISRYKTLLKIKKS